MRFEAVVTHGFGSSRCVGVRDSGDGEDEASDQLVVGFDKLLECIETVLEGHLLGIAGWRLVECAAVSGRWNKCITVKNSDLMARTLVLRASL
jgi:hypothetical protein